MPPPERPSGMVGKRELLEWASAMARRDVTSFADLRDGDALVRCMRETWPLAYDACRKPRARTTEGNFELIGDMFRHLSLPPAAFDRRGLRQGAFKPCYNFLVMAFFLRNLALHSDFSVDFTHAVDPTLAAFLQAPASIESLAKGGALANRRDEKDKALKRERDPRREPPADEKAPNPRDVVAERRIPAASRLSDSAVSQKSSSRENIRDATPNPPPRGRDAYPASAGPPPPSRRRVPVEVEAFSTDPSDVLGARKSRTPSTETSDARRSRAAALRAAARSEARASAAYYNSSSSGLSKADRGSRPFSSAPPGSAPPLAGERGGGTFRRAYEGRDPSGASPRGEPSPNVPRGVTTHSEASARTSDAAAALAEARFEIASLRRVLDAAKSERAQLVARHAAELDARDRAALAAQNAIRDAAASEAAARDLRHAARRDEDQRAFLRELRAVAEETAERAPERSSANEPDAKTNVAARLELARGREVRALEERVAALELERDAAEAKAKDALKAATRDAFSEEAGEGSDVTLNPDVTPGALAAALRRERAKNAAREDALRFDAARLRADLATARRELREVEARPDGSKDPGDDERKDAAGCTPGTKKADEGGAKAGAGGAGGAKEGTLSPGASTYARALETEREKRRAARLEADLFRAEAERELRKAQVAALEAEGAAGEGQDDLHPRDDEKDALERTTGAEADAADLGEILRVVDGLRRLASSELPEEETTLEDGTKARGASDASDRASLAAAAARAAEAAAWRRAAAGAVLRRRLRRLEAALIASTRKSETLSETLDAATTASETERAGLEAALRAATDDLARERATAGVRASLAEEAERVAREELEEARADASAFEARAKAAEGAGAGALRDARSDAAKLRLREKHWVGLIECHRGAARLSRELAEMAVEGGGDASRRAVDAAAGVDVARKRAEMEAEAEAHVEAIKAVARMATPELAESGATVGDGARDVAALSLRAETAEAAAASLRARLTRKTEEAASLSLRAKRHELRAAEETAERRRTAARLDAASAALEKAEATGDATRRAAEADSKALREDLDRARAALEDRDAALDAGAALVRADPETAALAMRGRASPSPSPRRRFGFFRGSRRVSLSGAEAEKEEDDGSAAPGGGTFRSVFRPKTKAPGSGSLRDPEAIALAVAAATRAIVSPSARSLEDGAFSLETGGDDDRRLMRAFDVAVAGTPPSAAARAGVDPNDAPGGEVPTPRTAASGTRRGGAAAARSRLDEERARGGGGGDGTPGAESTGSFAPTPPRAEVRDSREDPGEATDGAIGSSSPSPGRRGLLALFSPGGTRREPDVEEEELDSEATDEDAPGTPSRKEALGVVSSAGKEDENEKETRPGGSEARGASEAEGGFEASHPRLAALRDARSTPLGAAAARSGSPGGSHASLASLTTEASDASSLPGADAFMRRAERRLDIVVERRWFGLAQASPVRVRVRDGAGAVARDASAEENEAAARLLEETS